MKFRVETGIVDEHPARRKMCYNKVIKKNRSRNPAGHWKTRMTERRGLKEEKKSVFISCEFNNFLTFIIFSISRLRWPKLLLRCSLLSPSTLVAFVVGRRRSRFVLCANEKSPMKLIFIFGCAASSLRRPVLICLKLEFIRATTWCSPRALIKVHFT